MSSAKPVYTIYGDSCTIVAPSLNIFPVQITQSYVGDCPANTIDCLALQILSAKTYNRQFLENTTDKYARIDFKYPIGYFLLLVLYSSAPLN